MIVATLLFACVESPRLFVDSPLDGGVYDQGVPIDVRVRIDRRQPDVDIYLFLDGERTARWEYGETRDRPPSLVFLHPLGVLPVDDYDLLVEIQDDRSVYYETVEFSVRVPPETLPEPEDTGPVDASGDTGGGTTGE